MTALKHVSELNIFDVDILNKPKLTNLIHIISIQNLLDYRTKLSVFQEFFFVFQTNRIPNNRIR